MYIFNPDFSSELSIYLPLLPQHISCSGPASLGDFPTSVDSNFILPGTKAKILEVIIGVLWKSSWCNLQNICRIFFSPLLLFKSPSSLTQLTGAASWFVPLLHPRHTYRHIHYCMFLALQPESSFSTFLLKILQRPLILLRKSPGPYRGLPRLISSAPAPTPAITPLASSWAFLMFLHSHAPPQAFFYTSCSLFLLCSSPRCPHGRQPHPLAFD